MLLKKAICSQFMGIPTLTCFEKLTKIDYGMVSAWKEGEVVEGLPSSRDPRSFQLCFQLNSFNKFEEMTLFIDENFFILLRLDPKNPTRALVHSKIKHKQIVDTAIERKDNRNLIVAILSNSAPKGYVERILFFEDWRKATEIKQFFIDDKRKGQLYTEFDRVIDFLRDCEKEANGWLNPE
jgi:hypothetical protein